MKEEALKLADEIDNFLKEEEQLPWGTKQVYLDMASTMIRRLVEELDKTERKYKDMHNLATQAMSQLHQLEKDKNKEYNSMTAKPTITKLDGKVVAVTMTDDEHRITEVLWEAQKPLSDDEIHDIWKSLWEGGNIGHIAYNYTKAIEERHGIK